MSGDRVGKRHALPLVARFTNAGTIWLVFVRLSMFERIELAHCCCDVQNLHGMYAVYVGLNQWAVQRLKGLWEKLATKLEKRDAELDQLCNPKPNSAAMRALLRCEHEWMWPAFDDARLLNLNKKRREVDVLRCVRRCQRGEYVFAPQRRDRPLPLARA